MVNLAGTTTKNNVFIIEKVASDASGARYRCKCPVCGKTDWIVRASRLRNNKEQVTMCKNCSAKSNLKKIKTPYFKDITSMTFGHLHVLERTDQKNKTCYIWKCKCDCGNICYISGEYLRNGDTTSCGCINTSRGEEKIKQLLEQANIPFEKEKIFIDFTFPLTKRHPRFDFYINNSYLIEYDGKQHYIKDTGYGKDLSEIKNRDKIKNQWCIDNNIPLIRIPYTHLNELCLEDLLLETSNFIYKKEKDNKYE